MVGLSSAGPTPIEYMVALTAILASGAAIGTQVSAAVAYMVVMLAMVEIPLVQLPGKLGENRSGHAAGARLGAKAARLATSSPSPDPRRRHRCGGCSALVATGMS